MRPPNGNLNLDRAGRRAHERARSLKPCCFKINKDYHFSFFLPLCDFSQPPAVAVADGRLAAIMITIKLMMIRRRYLVALTLFAPCLACSFGDDDCARAAPPVGRRAKQRTIVMRQQLLLAANVAKPNRKEWEGEIFLASPS